jgi:hypothetical protein
MLCEHLFQSTLRRLQDLEALFDPVSQPGLAFLGETSPLSLKGWAEVGSLGR